MAAMNQMLPRPIARDDYRARFTTAEFLAMAATGAFADMRLELVRGELQRMNPPGTRHGSTQARVIVKLATALAGNDGLTLVGETAIDLGADTVLGADVALLSLAAVESRPAHVDEVLLVVEVSDATLARDLGDKADDYAAAGIATCWVVDVASEVTNVLTSPGPQGYASRRVVRFTEPLPVPGTDASITLA